MKGFPSKCPSCGNADFTSYYKEKEGTQERERWFKCNIHNCKHEYLME